MILNHKDKMQHDLERKYYRDFNSRNLTSLVSLKLPYSLPGAFLLEALFS